MKRPVHISSSCFEPFHRYSFTKSLNRHPIPGAFTKRRVATTLRIRFCECTAKWSDVKSQILAGEKIDLPTQGQSAVAGVELQEKPSEKKTPSDADYLSVALLG